MTESLEHPLHMKIKTEMTEEEKYRRNYILLILKGLKHCKTSIADDMTLNPEEKKVVEYHLKDVAQRTVIEDTSQEECVAIFKGRLSRLAKGYREEWINTANLISRHRLLISDNEAETLDTMCRAFFKKRTGALSEK